MIDLLLSAGWRDCPDATASVDDVVRALRLAFEVARRQRAEALWLDPEEGKVGCPPPALLETRRLAATGRTYLGVVHDLRNLLQPVLGYAELLSSETADAASRIDLARAIVELATELETLLSRALEMRPGHSAPVDVEADLLISRLGSLIRAVAGP